MVSQKPPKYKSPGFILGSKFHEPQGEGFIIWGFQFGQKNMFFAKNQRCPDFLRLRAKKNKFIEFDFEIGFRFKDLHKNDSLGLLSSISSPNFNLCLIMWINFSVAVPGWGAFIIGQNFEDPRGVFILWGAFSFGRPLFWGALYLGGLEGDMDPPL